MRVVLKTLGLISVCLISLSFNFIINSIKHGDTICDVIQSMTWWGWRRISSWIQTQVHHPSVSVLLQKEQKVLMKADTGNLSVV